MAKAGERVSFKVGGRYVRGKVKRVNTDKKKRHMGGGSFDMCQVVVSYVVEVELTGLDGEKRVTTGTVSAVAVCALGVW